jgi:hypothetical protein
MFLAMQLFAIFFLSGFNLQPAKCQQPKTVLIACNRETGVNDMYSLVSNRILHLKNRLALSRALPSPEGELAIRSFAAFQKVHGIKCDHPHLETGGISPFYLRMRTQSPCSIPDVPGF